ncbi:cytochrome c oxidase subunit 3 [Sphingobium sp. DEHP117]|uniref:cytochrome c oxidase subunit 3 n=1 Tax=Sphingobium sp. DEHP117 TaxID=2993436 RepID=UPI0027D52580|nr:cytochrome c oxidase subunit 3 [Sphingobium sp. DEHP117]MDQ4420384.1 cytochrome c oxidase subunit 3 [Sphingobium sp. DEHP117]
MSEPENRRIPAEAGVWVFVISDMMVFAIMFASFVYHRSQAPELYAMGSRPLSVGLGLLNTIVLLTGSLFVARGVEAFRIAHFDRSRRLILLGIACGALFVGVKCVEWNDAFVAGLTPLAGDFHMFYFMLTGIHLVHVILASILLIIVRNWKVDPARPAAALIATEAGGIVWHLVDLIWIVLFPLLYLTS